MRNTDSKTKELLQMLIADSEGYQNLSIPTSETERRTIIHTVGSIVYGELNGKLCKDLRNCYESVIKCCVDNHIKSVAFCCISTGEFHFPNDKAAEIAWESVTAFLETHGDHMERVIFNVFKDSDRKIYEKIAGLS